jgi:hypothetical protein
MKMAIEELEHNNRNGLGKMYRMGPSPKDGSYTYGVPMTREPGPVDTIKSWSIGNSPTAERARALAEKGKAEGFREFELTSNQIAKLKRGPDWSVQEWQEVGVTPPTTVPVKPAAPSATKRDPLATIINNMVSGIQGLFKKIGLGQINFKPPYKTNEWDGLNPPYKTNQWDGTVDDLGRGK